MRTVVNWLPAVDAYYTERTLRAALQVIDAEGGAVNHTIRSFTENTMYHILHGIVGFNTFSSGPFHSLGELQASWSGHSRVVETTDLCKAAVNALMVLMAIGRSSTVKELSVVWEEEECAEEGEEGDNKVQRRGWVNCMELLLDPTQPLYHNKTRDPTTNSIWADVELAFLCHGGFQVLLRLMTEEPGGGGRGTSPPGEQEDERVMLKRCRLAGFVKRLIISGLMPPAPTPKDSMEALDGEHMVPLPPERLVAAVEYIDRLGELAKGWVLQKLRRGPLDNQRGALPTTAEVAAAASPASGFAAGVSKHQVVTVLADIMTPEASLEVAQRLLELSELDALRAALRLLARRLQRMQWCREAALLAGEEVFGNSSDDISQQRLNDTVVGRFSGSGDVLVKQLAAAEVVDRHAMVGCFSELRELTCTNLDERSVCVAWGDLGLRCVRTRDEHTRNIGVSLLEALLSDSTSSHFVATDLQPQAEHTLNWLTNILMDKPGTKLAEALEEHNLSTTGAEWLPRLFQLLHGVLHRTGSMQSQTISQLWIDTAINCLRCVDELSVRKLGLDMYKNAVGAVEKGRGGTHRVSNAATWNEDTPMGQLSVLLDNPETVRTFVESIFTEQFADPNIVVLASEWFVGVYYRSYCYEDDVVSLMGYLVDAAVHDWGRTREAVTDLLVRISIANIAIKSLNSLCGSLCASIENKTTEVAGMKLARLWIEKTRSKSWVASVQERLLHLLWTMLMVYDGDDDDEDVASLVLEYAKAQFGNMSKHIGSSQHRVRYAGTHTAAKIQSARRCATCCAVDCFGELKKSFTRTVAVAAEPTTASVGRAEALTGKGSEGTEEDNRLHINLRSRATKAASLLTIILERTDSFLPNVLDEMHEGQPSAMIDLLFSEVCAAAQYQDVDSRAVSVRLDLLTLLSKALVESVPLSPARVMHVWDALDANHRPAVLAWITEVLAPSPPGKNGEGEGEDRATSSKEHEGKCCFAPDKGDETKEHVVQRLRGLLVAEVVGKVGDRGARRQEPCEHVARCLRSLGEY